MTKHNSSRRTKNNLLMESRVKAACKDCGVSRVSADFTKALNNEVHDLIERAVKRADASGRSTVRGSDL